MAVTLATALCLLATLTGAAFAKPCEKHHHDPIPSVVDVVRYGTACSCGKTLPYELEVPVTPPELPLRSYGYQVQAPPPPEPLPLYNYDYQLEVPLRPPQPVTRTYGYEVQAPPPTRRVPLYSYDYELEVPARPREPARLEGLEARLDRVLLPRRDCPRSLQFQSATPLLRGGPGPRLVEGDEELGSDRALPLGGAVRLLPTSGFDLPQDEIYDGRNTFQVLRSSPASVFSGGDDFTDEVVGVTGPAYLSGAVLGRDFRSDLHFAPDRQPVDDEPRYSPYSHHRPCHVY